MWKKVFLVLAIAILAVSLTGSVAAMDFTSPQLGSQNLYWSGKWWATYTGYQDDKCWNGGPEAVWIDGNGWIHLKMVWSSEYGQYCGAGINQHDYAQDVGIHYVRSLGMQPNDYYYLLESPIYLFATITKELDIEYFDSNLVPGHVNARYTVQPLATPGNAHDWWLSHPYAWLTHTIDWRGHIDQVEFQTWWYWEKKGTWRLEEEWTKIGGVPEGADNLRVHALIMRSEGFVAPKNPAPWPPEMILTEYGFLPH